ncbi:hypothetical protein A7K73_04870 [Candidatus Methylacidiphilum fumarolicum]|uniref:Uncharacterized protein n=2 Tax=Candidatus Methylacidiphilum fumarolicum TaxID=591154 RepID=I0JXU8_METFB|nr:zinc ribbon domain-containing protein [Candidatus Methylacidiphilum fumarolicum]MBW6414223.1 transposase [Candidatus Methylacidiphilum fumarolicum]TFE69943.1 hypothetical protein A7K73_04870 [Candidatus Methylacidiphilum fumarolicum]TFE73747.1 hypothetical protein A7K72_05465 [Candidatus Methylacidiphilum fumarolicum]TFE76810.1 hypothetical protein A7D33_08475 [Candidatus Methylacidiphilum fumarolicum]CAI9086392.1 conserved protein of unknown function [Candidatus Methylacidiphilum fumarolic
MTIDPPITIRFSKPLSIKLFKHWIKEIFENRPNSFNLWGHPIWLGPTKVHVYNIDCYYWKTFFLDITHNGIIAIMPNDRYMDIAYVGDKFVCRHCGYVSDADRVGAYNLKKRVKDPEISLWTPRDRVKAILSLRFSFRN